MSADAEAHGICSLILCTSRLNYIMRSRQKTTTPYKHLTTRPGRNTKLPLSCRYCCNFWTKHWFTSLESCYYFKVCTLLFVECFIRLLGYAFMAWTVVVKGCHFHVKSLVITLLIITFQHHNYVINIWIRVWDNIYLSWTDWRIIVLIPDNGTEFHWINWVFWEG